MSGTESLSNKEHLDTNQKGIFALVTGLTAIEEWAQNPQESRANISDMLKLTVTMHELSEALGVRSQSGFDGYPEVDRITAEYFIKFRPEWIARFMEKFEFAGKSEQKLTLQNKAPMSMDHVSAVGSTVPFITHDLWYDLLTVYSINQSSTLDGRNQAKAQTLMQQVANNCEQGQEIIKDPFRKKEISLKELHETVSQAMFTRGDIYGINTSAGTIPDEYQTTTVLWHPFWPRVISNNAMRKVAITRNNFNHVPQVSAKFDFHTEDDKQVYVTTLIEDNGLGVRPDIDRALSQVSHIDGRFGLIVGYQQNQGELMKKTLTTVMDRYKGSIRTSNIRGKGDNIVGSQIAVTLPLVVG